MASSSCALGFLGAGHIATALVRGFISAGYVRANGIIASATSEKSVEAIKKYGVIGTLNNSEVVRRSRVVWVAVKPHVVPSVLREVAPLVTKEHLIASVAAGVTIRTIEKNLPENTKVIRCMPNTPVIVRNGVSVYARGKTITEADKEKLDEMFASVGEGIEMQEHYMDIMTAVTGCGPSYMYMMLDALADGGVFAGVPKDIALKLTAYTMMGAAKMVLDNGIHPQQLKDEVCSPAGTSIQAIRTMEKAGFRGIMMDAVHAASKRALELSRVENGEEKDVFVKR